MIRRETIKSFADWWFAVAVVAALIAFAAPLLEGPTADDPTGRAGVFAPVVALCVAAMVLTAAISGKGLENRPIPCTCIGLGSVGSAYLWMAAESNTHPLDPQLSIALALLFAMAAIVLIGPLIAVIASRSTGKAPSD